MDFSTPLFGKKLVELTFQDITNFFATERAETDQLEFKSFDQNNDGYHGLIRTICGFLNSKGGLLIWGSPKGFIPKGRKEKIFIGDLTPMTKPLSKDSLISKCSDSIIPLPIGIRVTIILNEDNGCICVFEVDESNYSPHQFDKTYFMRIDGQTKPAPHHYIESLFKKIKFPELEGYLKFTKVFIKVNEIIIHFDIYIINWSPLMNAEDPIFRVTCDKGTFDPNINCTTNEYAKNPFINVLYYGQPFRDTNYVRIPIEEKSAYFVLIFGSRNSPSKCSRYSLNLQKIEIDNPERLVVERSENLLFSEIHDIDGATKQGFLEKLLGRIP